MRRDVHLKALKAASNVAFSIALVGCASASPDSTTDDQTASSSNESELKKKHPKACHDAGAPLDCHQVVDDAFPTAGSYPGKKQDVSEEVAACCDTLLAGGWTDAGAGEHRWDCCANAAHPDKVGIACTPWGPPVPPAMRRRDHEAA